MAAYGLSPDTEPVAYGGGHINRTFRLTTPRGDVLLQKVLSAVFPQPERVMANVAEVTAWLRRSIAARGGDPARETMEIIPLADGRLFLPDEDGLWRMYRFVGGSETWQQAGTPERFAEAGRGFGRFLRDLADFPAASLHETIPAFHHTPRRLEAFRQAVAEDRAGRAGEVAWEIDAFIRRSERTGALVDALERGELPLRVTHNDTKLNNVLMDAATQRALCVVDLDTVMPGLCAYDFGDAIRFGANTAAEDERDLSRVKFSMPMFEAFLGGYLGEAGDMLTPAEIRSLPLGAWMMTCECGMRFLTDYLNGDVYFRTAYPTHNLVRARNQLALLTDMERCEARMRAAAERWIKE